MLAVAALTLSLVAGAAFAQSISCPGGGRCTGTAGNDTMRGADMVKGKRAADVIEGGDGADKVKGGSGRDTVRGGTGNDIVRGGTHGRTNDGVRDVLDCGSGTDLVYFVQGQDSVRNCEVVNPPEA